MIITKNKNLIRVTLNMIFYCLKLTMEYLGSGIYCISEKKIHFKNFYFLKLFFLELTQLTHNLNLSWVKPRVSF
jgi:hypothetical protein